MPDETAMWTIDRLHAHLVDLLDERSRFFDERHNSLVKAMESRFAASERAVDKALEAAEKAVDRRQDNLDREFHEHLIQVRQENQLAFSNSDKAIGAALASAKEAVSKAELATERRFESVNAFRAQLSDQTNSFMPREVAEATYSELRTQILAIKSQNDAIAGRTEGIKMTGGVIVAAIAALGTLIVVVNIIIALATR